MKNWLLIAVLTICGAVGFSSCSSSKDNASDKGITMLADRVWMYGQTHPDGFMLDIRTMTEPTEGIAVSYGETQNSHSRQQLDKVVRHAVQHDGYVGGWLNSNDGLYYFDSSKLFTENELRSALQFGRDNRQYSVYILSLGTEIPVDGKVAEIVNRGTIIFGTTGD